MTDHEMHPTSATPDGDADLRVEVIRPARRLLVAGLATLALTVAAAACSDGDDTDGLASDETDQTQATTDTSTTSTTTEAPGYWDELDRANFLLLGSDAGVGRIGTRTDTLILVSMDPRNGDTAMFSIPRNLTEAPLHLFVMKAFARHLDRYARARETWLSRERRPSRGPRSAPDNRAVAITDDR